MGKDNAHVRFKRLHRWIALTATHEELVVRIAQEIHKAYKKNQVFDDSLLDLCRSMDDLFDHATRHQRELEDAVCGNKVTGFLARIFIERQVSRYKRLVADQAHELGIRAMHLDPRQFTDSKRIAGLVKRAHRCRDAADTAWEEIVKAYHERGADQQSSAIEWMLARTDKLAQKLLSYPSIRNVLGNAVRYEEGTREQVLDEKERGLAAWDDIELEPSEVTRSGKQPASTTWLGEQPAS